ncbi:hypothetical protein D3C84_897960 [compost metagenome]
MGQAVAALEADALPRRHQILLLPIAQPGGAREHIDELILQTVMVFERRDGPRCQGRQVDPKIGETEVVPQPAPGAVLDQGGKGLRIEGPGLVLRDLCGLNGRAVRHLNNLRIGALARAARDQPGACLSGSHAITQIRLKAGGCQRRDAKSGLPPSPAVQWFVCNPLQHLDLDLDKAGSGVAYGAECGP